MANRQLQQACLTQDASTRATARGSKSDFAKCEIACWSWPWMANRQLQHRSAPDLGGGGEDQSGALVLPIQKIFLVNRSALAKLAIDGCRVQ